MQTRVLPVSAASVAEAAAIVRAAGIVAVPTETVYGLAGDATDAAAIARIYAAKGRPSFNPLIVHVRDLPAAEAIGNFSKAARALAERHWPGPLTLVVPLRRGTAIAETTLAGLPSVAVRAPAHPAMQALLRAADVPLAAPSANASGMVSPTTAAHVLRTLEGKLPLILDGGPTQRGLESTIVAATDGPLRLLRPGPLDIDLPLARLGTGIEAPGQSISHYAPRKPLRLNAQAPRADEWLIGFGHLRGDSSLSPSGDLEEAGRNLFARLHEADLAPPSRIAVASVPDEGLGRAINDRLRRAAA